MREGGGDATAMPPARSHMTGKPSNFHFTDPHSSRLTRYRLAASLSLIFIVCYSRMYVANINQMRINIESGFQNEYVPIDDRFTRHIGNIVVEFMSKPKSEKGWETICTGNFYWQTYIDNLSISSCTDGQVCHGVTEAQHQTFTHASYDLDLCRARERCR